MARFPCRHQGNPWVCPDSPALVGDCAMACPKPRFVAGVLAGAQPGPGRPRRRPEGGGCLPRRRCRGDWVPSSSRRVSGRGAEHGHFLTSAHRGYFLPFLLALRHSPGPGYSCHLCPIRTPGGRSSLRRHASASHAMLAGFAPRARARVALAEAVMGPWLACSPTPLAFLFLLARPGWPVPGAGAL